MTDVVLPPQIQRQLDEANRIEAALAAPAPEADPQPQAPTETPPETVAEVVEAPKPPAQPEHDAEYWKARFSVIEGKYKAETPRLHQQLREQVQAAEQLQAELARLKQAQTEGTKDTALDTSKDEDTFGADLVGMIRRTALAIFQQHGNELVNGLRRELAEVRASAGTAQELVEKSAAERFWENVTRLVPDWAAVDNDPRWIEWLNTTPEFATATYRELASTAVQQGDFNKIAKLVEVWRGPAEPAPKPQSQAKSELARQVAPPKNAPAASTAPAQAKTFTGAEYQYWTDHRRTKDTEIGKLNQMLNELEQAVGEGRVSW